MADKRYKIGLLMHDAEMYDRFSYLEDELGCELVAEFVSLVTAATVAIRMEQSRHVEAIIAHSLNSAAIRPYVTIPVINLPLSDYSLAQALRRARAKGERIAHIDMSSGNSLVDYRDYSSIADLAGCADVQHYPCGNNDNELDAAMDAASRDGCDVLVGGTTVFREKAQFRGVAYEFIPTSELAMIYAINMAIYMARIHEGNIRRIGWMDSVINAFSNGILSTRLEEPREWVINGFNNTAVQKLRIGQGKVIGRSSKEAVKDYPILKQIFLVEPDDPQELSIYGESMIVSCNHMLDSLGKIIGKLYQLLPSDEIKKQELQLRKNTLKSGFSATTTFQDIVGGSAAIREAVDNAVKFAAVPSNILITGESGCGKELFAQSIHNASPYAAGPFLAINCATLPEALLEAELFGYEAGAFTGASAKGKAGLLETAHRGTLFLDEVAEMPLPLQAKLLRVLQERSFRRIGGAKNIVVDIRIISATHKNLAQEVREGRFRADLMYRINVMLLHIPPLRERPEDVATLAKHFARTISARLSKAFSLPDEAAAELSAYPWPGNVRELQNLVERLVVLSSDGTATPQQIRNLLGAGAAAELPPNRVVGSELTIPLGTMREMEESILRQLYAHVGKDRKKLANLVHLSDTTLWRRLKEYGLAESGRED